MKALISHSFGEIDSELGMDQVPVLTPSVPLFRNVHHRQIQHFQQAVVYSSRAYATLCRRDQTARNL